MKLPVVCFNVNFVAEFWKINHLVTSELVVVIYDPCKNIFAVKKRCVKNLRVTAIERSDI